MLPIGSRGGVDMYPGCGCFRDELGFLNCDYICMWPDVISFLHHVEYLGWIWLGVEFVSSRLDMMRCYFE